jgi:hypothetical protein
VFILVVIKKTKSIFFVILGGGKVFACNEGDAGQGHFARVSRTLGCSNGVYAYSARHALDTLLCGGTPYRHSYSGVPGVLR